MNCDRRNSIHFSAKIHRLAVWSTLLTHGLLLARIATVNAPVFDEIGHLPSGLSHWRFMTFDLYRVNPPLMRMIAATPLLLANPQTDWSIVTNVPNARSEFAVGTRFVELNRSEAFWYFTVCRFAQIPVSIFGGWICYRWAKQLYGSTSGLVALILWCFCPTTLAWGATITPDLGAATFGVAAGYAFWRWMKVPTWTTAVIAGLAFGLAQLSKSTWIILFVIWPLIWLCGEWSARHSCSAGHSAPQLAGILMLGLYVLNLGYGFEGSFQRLREFTFISRTFGEADANKNVGNRFRDAWIGVIPVPLPANYVMGIDIQKHDFEKGKWSYLHGEHRFGGWYHYYLYAFAVKTPLGTLLLLITAVVLVVRRREYLLSFRNDAVLLVPAIAVIALVSSQTGFNRYLRYILPAAPFLFVFASRVGKAFRLKQFVPQILCGICVTGTVVGSMAVFPHSMSYFNIAAGGPLDGPHHLLDANVDWGQDLLELKRFVDHHPETHPIYLSYFGVMDPKLAGLEYERIPQICGRHGQEVESKLKPGRYAISVNHLFGYRHYGPDDPDLTCFQCFTPDAMAGYSIYIYHLTPEKIRALSQRLKAQPSK